MKKTSLIVFATLLTVLPLASANEKIDSEENLVTSQIAEGIENHINEEAKKGGGFFKFSSGGEDYNFKLVKIHTEYLARLGPEEHFACVDLADEKGDMYDVDFFMSGKPGEMKVTSTTLHKLNGIPRYSWERNEKGVWEMIPMEDATPMHLGVKEGEDEFTFLYRMHIPELKHNAKVWIPHPQDDPYQEVELLGVESPENYEVLEEGEYGNKAFYFELNPANSGKKIDIRYHVKRREKTSYESAEKLQRYLEPDVMVPLQDNFKEIASKVVEGKKSELVKARALYDHTMDHMKYVKVGKGWGKGDAVYACDLKTGNCTDYHSYFIALARSVGIPAKFAIGAAIPSSRDECGVDGYHCWAEFYADGKWWPVDISEADKYSGLATYFFGHHPANRIEFSRGRDLVYNPGPSGGPINFHAYPVVETDGMIIKPKTKFFFKRDHSS